VSSYTIRDLCPELLARLRARAEQDGMPLSRAILSALTAYADGGIAAAGGRARAAAMTDAQRQASARHAAHARWRR